MTKQLKTIEILNPPKPSNTGGWILMDSGWLGLMYTLIKKSKDTL